MPRYYDVPLLPPPPLHTEWNQQEKVWRERLYDALGNLYSLVESISPGISGSIGATGATGAAGVAGSVGVPGVGGAPGTPGVGGTCEWFDLAPNLNTGRIVPLDGRDKCVGIGVDFDDLSGWPLTVGAYPYDKGRIRIVGQAQDDVWSYLSVYGGANTGNQAELQLRVRSYYIPAVPDIPETDTIETVPAFDGNELELMGISLGAHLYLGTAGTRRWGIHGDTGTLFSQLDTSITSSAGIDVSVDGLTSGVGIQVTSTSTAGAGGLSTTLLNLERTGATVAANHTAFGIRSTVTTTGYNVAGRFLASGSSAGNNVALWAVDGDVRIDDGTLMIGVAGLTTGLFTMSGATSGTVTVQVAAAAGTYTMTLPTTDGAASEFLQTDGAGVLSWAAPSTDSNWAYAATYLIPSDQGAVDQEDIQVGIGRNTTPDAGYYLQVGNVTDDHGHVYIQGQAADNVAAELKLTGRNTTTEKLTIGTQYAASPGRQQTDINWYNGEFNFKMGNGAQRVWYFGEGEGATWGHWIPGADNAYDIGNIATKVRHVYTTMGISGGNAGTLGLSTTGSVQIVLVNTSGHLYPLQSNMDVGLTGNRWRAGYFGSLVVTNGITLGGGASVTGYIYRSVSDGLTASTTQTQGQQPLTTEINVVTAVANANDVVTLPAAVSGMKIVIINHGANTLQVFPASGDAIDGGAADASVTQATTVNDVYYAINGNNWERVS